jgi:hypothetical protein
MDIAYSVRSRFLRVCEESIRQNCTELEAGGAVYVEFDGGGYGRRVIVTIETGAADRFGSDWEGKDTTRFLARIRAAATALRNCNCFGSYEIVHRDGALGIRSAPSNP